MPFPLDFIRILEDQFGKSRTDQILLNLEKPAYTAFRVNTAKWRKIPQQTPVPWSIGGSYLSERPQFVADPFWHAGCYYVQEPSSMVVGQIIHSLKENLEDGQSLVVLDLCSAPGGKSTDIINQLSSNDLLVSNEVIQSRVQVLKENVIKWGYPNHIITQNDPADFKRLPEFFDIVVADVPCSGEGLFRKDEAAMNEWSMQHVMHCQLRQQRILGDIWSSLKPGGYLIYSTCTFNAHENEKIAAWLTEQFDVENVDLQLSNIDSFHTEKQANHQIYKALPDNHAGEGFSFFVVKKSGQLATKAVNLKTPKSLNLDYLATEGGYFLHDKTIIFQTNPALISVLTKELRVVKSGVEIGQLIKEKLLPSHELSMCNVLKDNQFTGYELTYEQAIKYLRNETFDLTGEKGLGLVKYQGVILGFINHLGNRFNNLYPSQYRIRTGDVLRPQHILSA